MKYLFLTLSALVILASCNKEPKVTSNRENLLRAKKWKLSSGTMTVKKPNGKDTTLQYLTFLPDCYKDDYLTFDSMRRGTIYTSGTSCSAMDPASHGFVWQLSNNDNDIDLYDGFNNIFAVNDTIQYYHFDTLQQSPYLVLDSIVKTIDTIPGFLKSFIVLDTIRELRFTRAVLPQFDIYKADISNFSDNSFTINFSFKWLYPDSLNLHGGIPYNLPPIYREDTIHYKLTYTGF